jgi:hypothetical protein
MTMTHRILQPLCVLNLTLVLILASSTQVSAALSMKVDFGVSGSASGNDVQSGFYDWSDPVGGSWSIGGYGYDYNGSVATRSRVISGITVDLIHTGGGTYFRDIAGTVTGTLGDLLEEGLYTNSGTLVVDLKFTTLPAGAYTMSTYHHIQDTTGTWGGEEITVDTGSGFGGVLSSAPASTGLDGSSPGINTFSFAANGSDPVTVRVTANSGAADILMNGFELQQAEAVPEPSTFVLTALGLAGLGFVAWRKQKHFRR